MQTTILITGGAGYIGSAVGLLLAQHGYQIIILDTLIHRQQINSLTWGTVHAHDYGDSAMLDYLFTAYEIAAVIHCAGYRDANHSAIDPHGFYANNLVKTITLLDRMRAHHISSIVFASSSAVYGAPTTHLISETHAYIPSSPYGNSKAMIETLLRDYDTAYGINHVSLRLFEVAGAIPEYALWDHHVSDIKLIPLLIDAAITGKPFTLHGAAYETPDGTAIRDYIHVIDVAHACARALEHLMNGYPSDCFNIGTGIGSSIQTIIHSIEHLYGVTIPIRKTHARPSEPPLMVANIARAQDILGWIPRYSLEGIIRSTHRSLMQRKRSA